MPNCFVVSDTTKKTIQVFRGLEAQPIPEDVHCRLMAALQRKRAAGQEPQRTRTTALIRFPQGKFQTILRLAQLFHRHPGLVEKGP